MAKKSKEADQLYLESLSATLTGWNDPELRLARAFETNEFILFGQPIIPLNPSAGLPFYIEVLIRLREEERNLTPPGTFIPFLEYFGMMPLLDQWVIGHALEWWAANSDAQNNMLSINLSAETLGEPDFPEFVAGQLRIRGVPAKVLCFELAQQDVVPNAAQLARPAQQIKALGCSFAVTGLGSDVGAFQTLKTIPAGMIKIDGAIVRELNRDKLAQSRVRSVQEVCRKLGIRSIGEFVELAETRRLLREIGVDYAQGYGVARPEPLEK